MNLPFSLDQFLEVFRDYNLFVWPAQVLLYVLAAFALILPVFKTPVKDPIIVVILIVLWLWAGIVYHLLFFTAINKAAYGFGGLFIIQAILMLTWIFGQRRTGFKLDLSWHALLGYLFILYSLVIYPIVGNILGHHYPEKPLIGTPCPTTIFSFGILLLATGRIPIYVLVIPLLWSVVGLSASIHLRIWEDIGLVVAGLGGTMTLIIKNNQQKSASHESHS